MRHDAMLQPLIIYDDREWVAERLNRYTGIRRYGALHVRGRSVAQHFADALPEAARQRLITVEAGSRLDPVLAAIRTQQGGEGVLVVAARGAVADAGALRQVLQRMPYSDRPVVERRRNALFKYIPSLEAFRDVWERFAEGPLHLHADVDETSALLVGDSPLLDIGELPALLSFIAGATSARAFNVVSFDDLTYRKRSADKAKMRREHDYYGLIPQAMRPWMAGAFDYHEDAKGAEYTMLRYGFADAAFQWVQNAWSAQDYEGFLKRILFFLKTRPRRAAGQGEAEAAAEALFIQKVIDRRARLENDPAGRSLLATLSSGPGGHRIAQTFDEYLDLARTHRRRFASKELAIGHGDPCLSNILYDPVTTTMKLVDPAGASSESELWTHPLYDYCKLAHSIVGDYDFINSLLFQVSLDATGAHTLTLERAPPPNYKQEFEILIAREVDIGAVRLGVVSLFLSMLPLHLDYPNKVAAFLLRARTLLDQAKAAL